MKIRRMSAEQFTNRASATPYLQGQVANLMAIEPEPEGPGFFETAGAAFMVDGVLTDLAGRGYNAITAGARADSVGRSGIDPETWNRFTYMKEAWDEGTMKAMEPFVRRGAFDHSMSPDEVEMKRLNIEDEIKRREDIEQGNMFGAMLGSTAAGALDLIALEVLTGGAGSGAAAGISARIGSRVGRVAFGAGAGALANAIPEAILHQTQELRTLEESIMAVGTGAVLGGGVGAFSRSALPDSPLHSKHKDNPLSAENLYKQDEKIREVGNDNEEILQPEEYASSVGAAQIGPEVAEGVVPTSAVGRWLNKRTPLGRSLHYSSNVVRDRMSKIINHGGIRHDRTQRETMEDLLEGYEFRTNALVDSLQQVWKSTNVEMGHSRAGVAIHSIDPTQRLFKGMVGRREFDDVTQKLLHNDWRETDQLELAARFGEDGAKTIIRNAEIAKGYHLKENQLISDELKELNLLQDKSALDKAISERKALREQRKEMKKNVGDENTPADTGDIDAKIKELDSIVAKQRSLPEDLGDQYAHAQLYSRDAIRNRPEKFKELLREKLKGEIPEDWLDENYGLTLEEFTQLGPGSAQRKQILEDWFGDEKVWKVEQAGLKVEDAERLFKDGQKSVAQLARDFRIAGKEEVRLSAQEARARTSRLTARREQLKAEAVKLREEGNLLREAATGAREAGLNRQKSFLNDPVTKSIKEAEAKGRTAEISKKLTEIERKIKTLDEAESRWNQAVNALEQSNQHLKARQRQLKDMLSQLSRETKQDIKSLAQARKALSKAQKAPGLEKYLDNLTKNLMENREIPSGALDTIVPETGRVKARRIKYTADERRMMEAEGFLESDLSYITTIAHRQLNGHLSIDRGMKGMGYDGAGDWGKMVEDIQNDYHALNARHGDGKFNEEMRQALLDMQTFKDRILGHEAVPSKGNEGYHWASRKLRQSTYMAMGSTMGLSSIVDLGTMFFTHGPAGKLYTKSMKQTAKIMKDRIAKHPELRTEFERLVGSLEVGLSAAMRANRTFELDDGIVSPQLGRAGTAGRKVSDAVDYLFDAGVNLTSNVSFLRPWNRMQTIASHLMTAHKLNDLLVKKTWDQLSDAEIGRLSDVGIEKSDAKLLRKYLSEHASFDKEVDVRLDEWVGKEGQEAQRLLIQAMKRESSRAVIRPGIGDRPRLLSHPVGQVLMQFQSFPFAFANKFITPASQRAANGEALQAVGGLAAMLTLGGVVATLKAITRGEDPVEMWTTKPKGQLAMEVIDRSGMTAFLAPYIAAGITASSSLREGTVFEHLGQSSRFRQNNALMSLLGANFSQLRRGEDVLTSLLSGDNSEDVVQKLSRITPLNAQLKLMMNLIDVTGE